MGEASDGMRRTLGRVAPGALPAKRATGRVRAASLVLWAGLLLFQARQAQAQNWVTAQLRTVELGFFNWTFEVSFSRPVRQFAPFNT